MKVHIMQAIGLVLACVSPASAATTANPDWPCVQRKVLVLTSTQLWDGPPVDGISGFNDDESIVKLVPLMLSRRVAVEDAVKQIKTYAGALAPAERDEKLKLLFAGYLKAVNNERSSVIGGLERFLKRQRDRAAALERLDEEVRALKAKAAGDEAARVKQTEAEERYAWDARVFTERQQSLPVACEIPVLIEQRAFDLGREIRKLMSK